MLQKNSKWLAVILGIMTAITLIGCTTEENGVGSGANQNSQQPTYSVVDFLGKWENVKQENSAVTTVWIRPDKYEDVLLIEMWGAFGKPTGYWGQAKVDFADVEDGKLSVIWDMDGTQHKQEVSIRRDRRLGVEGCCHYTDGSSRPDVHYLEVLNKI